MAGEKAERHHREHAVALQYKEADSLPKVLAAGEGEIARQIVRLAEQHKIPVKQDEVLTSMLKKLPPGAFVTPESFRLVAELICFLYKTDKEWREAHSHVARGKAPEPTEE